MKDKSTYRGILLREFERRRTKNGRYSLRSFAKALDIDAGQLSRVLSGKETLSLRTATRIMEALDFSLAERDAFLGMLSREVSGFEPQQSEAATMTAVDVDTFKAICDLHHYAILELTYTDGFQGDPQWISSALGISKQDAKEAVERLIRLGILERQGASLRKTHANLTTARKDVTTQAHRKQQRQILYRAIRSLERDPLGRRYMHGMTLAINPEKLPEARQMALEFMEKLGDLLEVAPQKKVYQVAFSLFPLQETVDGPTKSDERSL